MASFFSSPARSQARLWLGVLLLGSLSACLSDFDKLTRTKLADWNPDFGIPLVDDNLSVENIVAEKADKTQLGVNDEGVYEFTYSNFVNSPPMGEVFPIPAVSRNLALPIPGNASPSGAITSNTSLDFPFGSGAQIRLLTLKAGRPTVEVSSSFAKPVDLTLTFPELRRISDDVPLRLTLTVPANASASLPVLSLEGYKASFTTSPGTSTLAVQASANVIGTGTVANGTLTITLGLQNAAYKYIEGNFGTLQLLGPTMGNIDISIFDRTFGEDNQIIFTDPKLVVKGTNTVGIGATVRVDSIWAYQDTRDPLSQKRRLTGPGVNELNPFALAAAGRSGSALEPSISASFFNKLLDKTNTNVNDIIRFYENVPRGVEFRVRANVNNPGPGVTTQFAYDTSRVRVEAQTILPCDGRVVRLTIQDTFDLELPENDDNLTVESASVNTIFGNGFPAVIRSQIYFVNEAGGIIDSLFSPTGGAGDLLADAADTTADGRAIQSPKKTTRRTVIISAARYDRLQKEAKKAYYRGSLNTPGTGSHKIYNNYRMRVQLGLRVKFRVKA